MLISWIENKLSQKLFEKKQEVIRLRWKKDQMERDLKRMKAAVDKLKMLQNGKADLEGMTETDCLELFGISRAQALANTNAALAKTEQEIFRAEHPLKAAMPTEVRPSGSATVVS